MVRPYRDLTEAVMARAAQYVVWGWKPGVVTEPIRLTGGNLRQCNAGRRQYDGEGWLTAIYAPGTAPEGLRARVAAIAAERAA